MVTSPTPKEQAMENLDTIIALACANSKHSVESWMVIRASIMDYIQALEKKVVELEAEQRRTAPKFDPGKFRGIY